MRKVDTDLQVCQLWQVFSQHICTFIEENLTIGAAVDTPRHHRFAMDSASGYLLDADLLLSMCRKAATTNFATAK